jgi:hypothetical protein
MSCPMRSIVNSSSKMCLHLTTFHFVRLMEQSILFSNSKQASNTRDIKKISVVIHKRKHRGLHNVFVVFFQFVINDTTIVGLQTAGCHYYPNAYLMSLLLFLGTFLVSYNLRQFREQVSCFIQINQMQYTACLLDFCLYLTHRSLETRINLSADLYNISPTKNRPF